MAGGKTHRDLKPLPSEDYEFSLADRHEDPRMQPRQQGDYGTHERTLSRRANPRYNLRPAPSPAAATDRPGASRRQSTAAHEGELSCSTWDYDSESRQAAANDELPIFSEGKSYSIRKRSPEPWGTSGHTSLALDDSGLLPLTSPETAEEQGGNVKRAMERTKKRKHQHIQEDPIKL